MMVELMKKRQMSSLRPFARFVICQPLVSLVLDFLKRKTKNFPPKKVKISQCIKMRLEAKWMHTKEVGTLVFAKG